MHDPLQCILMKLLGMLKDYNSKDGILIEPNGVKTATGIPSTVEAHKVERIFNEDGV